MIDRKIVDSHVVLAFEFPNRLFHRIEFIIIPTPFLDRIRLLPPVELFQGLPQKAFITQYRPERRAQQGELFEQFDVGNSIERNQLANKALLSPYSY